MQEYDFFHLSIYVYLGLWTTVFFGRQRKCIRLTSQISVIFRVRQFFLSLGSRRSGADKAIGTPHSSSYFISIRSESDGCDRRDYYLMNPLKDNYSNEGYNWSDDDYGRLPSPGRTTQHSQSIVCREDTKAALSAVRDLPSAVEKTRGRCYFRYELRRARGNNRGHVWFKLALHSNIQRGVPSARSRMERVAVGGEKRPSTCRASLRLNCNDA